MREPRIALQYATAREHIPAGADLRTWARAALAATGARAVELTLRVVGENESARLNQQYRHRPGPTNVLSFPFIAPPGLPAPCALAGDLIVCAPVVAREAAAQGKSLAAHWAHIVVHGVLHLRGFDHGDDSAAARMEALETRVLHELGFPAPYEYTHSVDVARGDA